MMMDQPNLINSLSDGDFIVNGNEFDDDNPATASALGNVDLDIDRLLVEESRGSGLNFDDSELVNLMSHEQSAVPGSNMEQSESNLSGGSIDNLVSMPMVEIEGADTAMSFDINNMKRIGQNVNNQEMNMSNKNNDPLLGNLMAQMVHQQQQQQQQQQLQQQSPMNNRNIQQQLNVRQMMEQAQQQRQGMFQSQQQPNIDHLEQEKLKLLNKLNELSMRQNQVNPNLMMNQMNVNNLNQQININPQLLQQMNINNLQQQRQQQRQQQNNAMQHMGGVMPMGNVQQQMKQKPTLANGIASMSVSDKGTPAESPLTSFLRAGKKGQGMNSHAMTSKPASASVFSEKPSMSVDPFNKRRPATNTQKQLLGAMDRSTYSQNMVKQLNFMTTDSTGVDISQRSAGTSGNAQWGAVLGGNEPQPHGYRYSGILSKHASDGHLLRTKNLARSKGKVTSLSKDNMMMARTKGKGTDQSLGGLLKRSSSKNLVDKGGDVYAKKRVGNAKYKFGVSGSVPGQLNNHKGGGGGTAHGGESSGNQGNAQW